MRVITQEKRKLFRFANTKNKRSTRAWHWARVDATLLSQMRFLFGVVFVCQPSDKGLVFIILHAIALLRYIDLIQLFGISSNKHSVQSRKTHCAQRTLNGAGWLFSNRSFLHVRIELTLTAVQIQPPVAWYFKCCISIALKWVNFNHLTTTTRKPASCMYSDSRTPIEPNSIDRECRSTFAFNLA